MTKLRLLLGGVIIMIAIAAPGIAPAHVSEAASAITCKGNLIVNAVNSDAGLVYRVGGTGPGLPSAFQPGGGPLTFTIAGPGTWTNVTVQYYAVVFNEWRTFGYAFTAECGPEPNKTESGSAAASEPGCDVYLDIPATAVVGTFLTDVVADWAPGQETGPAVTLEAGKTAWVLGVDESGAYYKILWSCQALWVPVGTMGPNPDDVWQGAYLPTTVVD